MYIGCHGRIILIFCIHAKTSSYHIPKYKYEMPQMLKDAGYYTFGIGKMHWRPQRAKHGFE